jgi:serpin B
MCLIMVFLICFGCFLVDQGSAQEKGTPLTSLSESEVLHFQMIVQGNNRFAFDFYNRIKNQIGNLYFSPYSIVNGLAMAAIGAKGETAREFQHAFRYSPSLLLLFGDLDQSLQNPSGSKYASRVILADALWFDKNLQILPSFKQLMQRNFRTEIQTVDFAGGLGMAIQKINQWVLQKTNRVIANMLSVQDTTVNVQMLLTTAAYFQGQWAVPFDQSLTKRLPFRMSPQRTFLSDMMQNTSNFSFLEGEQWDIVVIPFEYDSQGPQLTMVILLPKKDNPLNELERNFTWENWQQWKGQLKEQRVTVTLPRIRSEKRIDLENPLKGLGFASLFTPQADFSAITGKKEIFLQDAFHKVDLHLDEKGAEMLGGPLPKRMRVQTEGEAASYEFMADHPFLYMIWDKRTDSILFMGRLSVP